MKRSSTVILVESAVMVALASVLSMFKLVEMPYGGSVTFASMLPIIALSYRHGARVGLGAGLVFAIVQQLMGLKYISYFTTPMSIIALILLDYILAFVFVGLGGIFRGKVKGQANAATLGALTVCLIRYLCHVISGCTIWAGLSIPTSAALIYSLGYNATYMLPETVVLVAATYYLTNAVDLTSKDIKRISHTEGAGNALYYYISGGALLVGVIADTVLIAPHTQNPETGSFDLSYLSEVSWIWVGVVSAVCVLVALTSYLLARAKGKRAE